MKLALWLICLLWSDLTVHFLDVKFTLNFLEFVYNISWDGE